jgi:hypothetical protein
MVSQPFDESETYTQSGKRTGTDRNGNGGEIGKLAIGFVEHRLD